MWSINIADDLFKNLNAIQNIDFYLVDAFRAELLNIADIIFAQKCLHENISYLVHLCVVCIQI